MLIVEKLEVAIRPGLTPKSIGYLEHKFTSRSEAEEAITNEVKEYDIRGKDEMQDYWWCRKHGDQKNIVFVIRPANRGSSGSTDLFMWPPFVDLATQ